MRKAFGDDAFNASTRAYFDDILRKNTEFVSGKLKVYNNQISIWQKGKAFVTGKEPIQATQTINYNIPIMDLNKMAPPMSSNINGAVHKIKVFIFNGGLYNTKSP